MEPSIIYTDSEFVVLSKPTGWITNDAETTKDQPTVQTFVREKGLSKLSQEFRNGIVHRLDKETSGILLVAKSQDAFSELQRQFKAREVAKSYVALAHGKIEPKEGEVDVPVGRLPWNRRRFGILPEGRDSTTEYFVDAYYARESDQFSLVILYPKTGRTHQIRIHLKYLGHPIVADSFYAGRKTSRKDRAWCPRLFLHAMKITFKHPKTKEQVNFEAPLPNDLSDVLSVLEKQQVSD